MTILKSIRLFGQALVMHQMRRFPITWTCNICRRVRPDSEIGVYNIDISKEHGFEVGTIVLNVRYCTDTPKCILAAPNFRLDFKVEEDGDQGQSR